MIIYPIEKRYFRGQINNVRGNIVRHPAYIVGEDGGCYLSFTLTHSPKKDGAYKNYPLKVNPDPKDKKDSYMRKQLQRAPQSMYTDWEYKRMKMSDEDAAYVEMLIRRWLQKKMSPVRDQPLAKDTHQVGDTNILQHKEDIRRPNFAKKCDKT